MLKGILGNLCPGCKAGRVFRGFYSMNKTCPSCGLRFEREPGYFLGAMVFGYVLGAASTIPTIVIAVFVYRAPIPAAIGIACGQVIVLNPFLFKYCRLAWLWMDRHISGVEQR
jgi:uncharacterized protein (DUF983 family)